MRKLASIQRILEVKPIEGADRIEMVRVLGWQCVANKGQFKEGDMCVYFEIDSFLPIRPEFEFLRKNCYKNSEVLGEGFRLKTMKFKGQISQGLVLPLKEVGILYIENGDNYNDARDYIYSAPDGNIYEMIEMISPTAYNNLNMEGTDVTEMLNIREWEISERASTGGTIKGNLPYTVRKTDETRIQSMPELLEEFRGIPYYITTKYDGSSHSVSIDDYGEFHVTGHNYEYKDDGTSAFYEFVKKKEFEEILRQFLATTGHKSITVQGEWCGPGLQKNRLKLAKPNWFVFTIDIDGHRVGYKDLCEITKLCEMNMVEVQETGDDLIVKYPDVDALLKRSEDSVNISKVYRGGQPEGIVIRPMEPVNSKVLGTDLSMKVINNNYLV